MDPRRQYICESCKLLEKPLVVSKCQGCMKLRKKGARAQKPDHYRKYDVEWRARNLEKARACEKRWRELNPELVKKHSRDSLRRRKERDPDYYIKCHAKDRYGQYWEAAYLRTKLKKELKAQQDGPQYLNLIKEPNLYETRELVGSCIEGNTMGHPPTDEGKKNRLARGKCSRESIGADSNSGQNGANHCKTNKLSPECETVGVHRSQVRGGSLCGARMRLF